MKDHLENKNKFLIDKQWASQTDIRNKYEMVVLSFYIRII